MKQLNFKTVPSILNVLFMKDLRAFSFLLDPQQQPDGSYEIGTVIPSVLPSVWLFSSNCIFSFF